MDWNTKYTKLEKPELSQIGQFIRNPLWEELRAHLEESYHILPLVEHSTCSGAPGWNVKYRKSSRSLCVLYPEAGAFTCLVTVGGEVAAAVDLMLETFTPQVRELYRGAKPFNGSRWLMIPVRDAATLEDVKRLLALRVQYKR